MKIKAIVDIKSTEYQRIMNVYGETVGVDDYHKLIKYLEANLKYEESIVNYILYSIAKAGMRYGEIVGLRDSDTNFEEFYLHTHKRYNTSTWKWTNAKNDSSKRYVPIDDKTVTVLPNMIKERKRINSLLQIKKQREISLLSL